jgi:hypothetical protein
MLAVLENRENNALSSAIGESGFFFKLIECE